jgi:hypothetical protein
MISTHVGIYGDTGRFCAEAVIRYAPLFDGLSPLAFRIILAPVELVPYLLVSFPTDVWPTQKRWSYHLTEVEAYRWPHTLRALIADSDRRLQAA